MPWGGDRLELERSGQAASDVFGVRVGWKGSCTAGAAMGQKNVAFNGKNNSFNSDICTGLRTENKKQLMVSSYVFANSQVRKSMEKELLLRSKSVWILVITWDLSVCFDSSSLICKLSYFMGTVDFEKSFAKQSIGQFTNRHPPAGRKAFGTTRRWVARGEVRRKVHVAWNCWPARCSSSFSCSARAWLEIKVCKMWDGKKRHVETCCDHLWFMIYVPKWFCSGSTSPLELKGELRMQLQKMQPG